MIIKENNRIHYKSSSILVMPQELRTFTLQNCISASPYNKGYSGSFYNTNEKSWDYTPDGTIRVSDHWNFYSQGTIHCITDIDDKKIVGKWVVAQYSASTNRWNVISADEKDFTALQKNALRAKQKSVIDPLVENANKRSTLLAKIRAERRAAARAKKIANKTLWVIFETNIWSKGTRGRWNHCGTQKHLGQFIRETACTVTIKEGSHINTYKNVTGYQELKRKPITKKAPK